MSKDALAEALLPRYRVQGEIGRGGMATVYRALDTRIDRTVAIKVLDSEVASTLDPARFDREIRLAGSLDHPNILSVLDSGEAGQFLYYVMPLVDGDPLSDRIAGEGTISLTETRRITSAVAAGLDHAHRQGIVHRDIKPGNILVSGDRVFVADFGVARMFSPGEDDRITETGHTVGTPAYLSPEQAGGGMEPDARSDIYSLGCVVHEMLAGEPPFTGRTGQAVIAQQISAPPPRLDVVRPDLPGAVSDAVERALAKAPADRFGSAGEFARSLEKEGPGRRTRRSAGLPASMAGVVVILLLGWWWVGRTGPLGPNRIVVFPAAVTIAGAAAPLGWEIALAIGAALEHAEPLRFIDGYRWLSPEARGDPGRLSPREFAEIARELGAGHYVEGVVHGTEAEPRLTVRLHASTRPGDGIAQATVEGAAGPDAPALALASVIPLLRPLLDPTRSIDISALSDRTAASNLLWLQGERAYGQSRFVEALDFYQRAVAQDSLHVFAALKGARSAHWESRFTEAAELVAIADRNRDLLPTRYRHYLDGMAAFLDGDAERSLTAIDSARSTAPDWPEAQALAGEVYYHLLPRDAVRPDSTSENLFLSSVQDSVFTPPLFHLAELALRKGDLEEARGFVERWRAVRPDSTNLLQVELSLECAEEGWSQERWGELIPLDPRAVWQAAISLSVTRPLADCATTAFEALLESEQPRSVRWSALTHLFGRAMAYGQYERADSLVQFGVNEGGIGAARQLYLYGHLGGAPFQGQVAELVRLLRQSDEALLPDAPLEWRWMLGVWLAHEGEAADLAELIDSMRSGDQGAAPLRDRLANDLEARLSALRGDRRRAIRLLDETEYVAVRTSVVAAPHYSFGPERLLLAELLLDEGDPAAAWVTAGLLDHWAPSIYPTLLHRSLQLRLRAARAMGDDHLAEAMTDRLASLGHAPGDPFTDPR